MTVSGSGPSATPTVRDVAEHAGVSPMTVSRTLSGGKNVRAEVQEKVWAAVEELGYHRNENARSIRPGHSSGLIGVAITNLGNPYYGQFALGVEEVASLHGRRIMLGNTGEQLARESQLVSDFIGRQVEGLIVVPTGEGAEHLTPGRLGSVPLVLASRTVEGLDADTVLLDDINGAYEATKALIDGGHTRIGFLGNVLSVSTARRRYEGFVRALHEAGLEPDPALIRRGQQDVAAARRAMEELLGLDDPPTAIFSANNRNTIGALQAIGTRQKDGPAIPAPTLVGFDDVELADMLQVPLIIVSHDPRQLGAQAARMLFDRLDDPEMDESPRLVELPVTVGTLRG
ncbi:LacI family DNA-binding transcriptional regulator [Amnibacterium flavum]|uniref:LacI family transcriptional regulator n=1 Tax=Amnibacterium flavum TaxID=2173173 RepID=A0A2V1HPD6_9MICO|nr:LacI family DNA-binding transcriptional regulator [Amnibacterium flavum]PVZ93472.1 LacI family transcriptional regulator [Amnibacterium flavum]